MDGNSFQFNNGGFMLSGTNLTFVKNYMFQATFDWLAFLNLFFTNVNIQLSTFSFFTPVQKASFIRFETKALYSDEVLFESPFSIQYLLYDTFVFQNCSLSNSNISFLNVVQSINNILINNSLFYNCGIESLNFVEGSIESNVTLFQTYFAIIKADYFQAFRFSRNINFLNNLFISFSISNFMETSIFSSSDITSNFDLNTNIFFNISLKKGGFTFKGLFVKSAKTYTITNNIFFRIEASKYSGSLFNFKYIYAALSRNLVVFISGIDVFRADSHVEINKPYLEVSNLVLYCTRQQIGFILNVNNFDKLIIQQAYFLANPEKEFFSRNALSFRSYIGNLSIIGCFFMSLKTVEGAISLSLANIGNMNIHDNLFQNNKEMDLSADIAVETIEKLNKISELDSDKAMGIYKNIFVNSSGNTGGSIIILSGSEIYITKCIFVNVTALSSGGAVYFENKVQATLCSSMFFNSNSSEIGGILYSYSSDILLFNLTIQNVSALKGGAIYLENTVMRLKDMILVNSQADFGGGIFASSSYIDISSLFTRFTSATASGGCFYQTRGTLVLKNIKMDYCFGKISGGCLFLESLDQLNVFRISLTDSKVSKDGIIFVISKISSFNTINDLTCNKNAADGIGACLIIRSGRSILKNIEISFSRSSLAAVFIYSLTDTIKLNINNLRLFDNYFETSGLSLEKVDCKINGMFAKANGFSASRTVASLIKTVNSHLQIDYLNYFGAASREQIFIGENSIATLSNHYYDLNSKGGGIVCDFCSSLTLFRVKIIKANIGLKDSAGGCIRVQETPTTVINCVFADIVAAQGGAIFALDSNISITNTTFIKGTSEKGGCFIFMIGEKASRLSLLFVENSTFLEGKGNFLDVKKISGIKIDNCTFIQIFLKSTISSKAFNFDSISEINLNLVKIMNFFENGGIMIKYSNIFLFQNSIIMSSLSNFSGGGLFLDSVMYTFINTSTFLNNSATTDGGALYYLCPKKNCALNIENSIFKFNKAGRYGSVLKSEDMDANFSLSNLIDNNYSPTDTDISSFPSKIYYVNAGAYSLDLGVLVSGRDTNLLFEIVDNSNKTFFYDNNGKMEFFAYTEKGEAISFQNEKALIRQGRAIYTGFSIVAKPGKSYKVGLQYSNDLTGKSFSQDFTLSLRDCIKGEILSGDICSPCKPSFYSLDQYPMTKNNSFCKACPENALCPGGSVIIPRPGFWIKDENQSYIVECAYRGSCPDRNSMTKSNTICSTGFRGNLCFTCEKGYGKFSDKECVKCSNSNLLYFRFTFMCLFSLSFLAYQTNAAFEFTTIESKRRSLVKIVVDHISYISFISRFNVNWDAIIFNFFSINDQYITTAPKEMFNFECFINQAFSGEDIFLANSVVVSLTPFFYGCLALAILYIFHGLLKLKERWFPSKKEITPDRTKPSIQVHSAETLTKIEISLKSNNKTVEKNISALCVIVFYNFYPRILINGLQYLKCIKIDETEDLYLEAYPDLKCWQSVHVKYLLFIVIPNLLFWGCLIPILFYGLPKIIIKRSKRENSKHPASEKQSVYSDLLSFLTLDFKDKYYYWEVYTYLNKFVIAIFMVITSRFAPLSQGALLIFIFLGLFLIQEHFKPYRYPFINNFKTYSLMTTICTSAFAILSSDQSQNNDQRFFYLLCVLILNIFFYAVWIYYFFQESIKVTTIDLFRRISGSLKSKPKNN